jgi:hypothetical protein
MNPIVLHAPIPKVRRHIGAQIIAHRLGIPVHPREEVPHSVRSRIARRLGQLPVVLALHRRQQAAQIGRRPPPRLRTPEPRCDPRHNLLQTLCPIQRLAHRRHRQHLPLPAITLKPGCSTRTRSLAQAVGLSQSAVVRIWHAFASQPHRSETFKLSRDPLFVGKVRDIVGLYVNPPDHVSVSTKDGLIFYND